MKYNADQTPNPQDWLELDETERQILVEEYHEQTGVELPNARLHAAFHVIVENQIALGDATPVRKTLERLIYEGLDRHDALHAISAVLSEKIFEVMSGDFEGEYVSDEYFDKLEQLTAEAWKRGDYGLE